MRVVWFSVSCSLLLTLSFVSQLSAQEEGCCQFFARAEARRGPRRCAELTREQCDLLKPSSTFFRGWHCDVREQRCNRELPPSTPTPRQSPTPTATPRVDPMGCCQLDSLRRVGHSVCGNALSQTSCLNDFTGVPAFCANCVCSSHPQRGFDLDAGACVTPTPTQSEPKGCCQLDHLTGVRGSVCGNAIRQSTCINDFPGGGTFCADCVCASHTGPGFQFTTGTCGTPPTPGRPRHNPHPPHRPTRS